VGLATACPWWALSMLISKAWKMDSMPLDLVRLVEESRDGPPSLKSLDYNPDEIDVKAVVSAFIKNVGPERFESVLLGIIDLNSLVFIEFLND